MRDTFPFIDTLVLPTDAVSGTRIVLDGTTGEIRFYDQNDDLVGFLSPDVWYTGLEGNAQAQMDPFGGFRVFNDDGLLAGIFSAINGLEIYDPDTGVVSSFDFDSLDINTETDTMGFGILAGGPIITGYRGSSSLLPGTTITTPIYAGPAVADGVDVRHVAAFDVTTLGTQTWTAPAGYTEQSDSFDGTGEGSLSTSVATRDTATGGIQTFTSTHSGWEMDTGTTILVRGISGTAAYRSISVGTFVKGTGNAFNMSLTPPAGIVVGDVLLAFVAYGCDGLDATGATFPTSWNTPTGWRFLGAQTNTDGSGITGRTIATGVWTKTATSSEPATYDVTANVPGNGYKIFHPVIVAVQGPDTQPSGPDIQINKKSIGRGIERINVETSNSALFTATTDNLLTISNVSVIANRIYEVRFHANIEWASLGADATWRFDLMVNGALYDVFARLEPGVTGTRNFPINGVVPWIPTITADTDDINLRVTEIVGGADITFLGSATERYYLSITDIGLVATE